MTINKHKSRRPLLFAGLLVIALLLFLLIRENRLAGLSHEERRIVAVADHEMMARGHDLSDFKLFFDRNNTVWHQEFAQQVNPKVRRDPGGLEGMNYQVVYYYRRGRLWTTRPNGTIKVFVEPRTQRVLTVSRAH